MLVSCGELLDAVGRGDRQLVEVFVVLSDDKAGDLAGSRLAGFGVGGQDLITKLDVLDVLGGAVSHEDISSG